MRSRLISFIFISIGLLFIISRANVSFSADTVTVTGRVTDYHEIMTDDEEIYNISDDPKSMEVAELVGLKVTVTGRVEVDEDTDVKTIIVNKFHIIEEDEEFEAELDDSEPGDELGIEDQENEEEFEYDSGDSDN